MEENSINARIQTLFELNKVDNKPLTSTSVSKATGIGRVTLDNYRSGKQAPSARNATIIADYFGVTYEWLLAGRGDMYANEGVVADNDTQIPLSIVRMMHEERQKHYEENRLLLDEIQKLSSTVQQQMAELKKIAVQKEGPVECADAG